MDTKLLFNFHGHTNFSDGQAVFTDYIEEALKLGFKAVGFTEHTPVPFYSTWNMKAEKLDEYLNAIAELRKNYENRLQIYAGLEVDYFEPYYHQITSLAQIDKLDYFIGSVHYLDFIEENQPWCIDTSIEEFELGYSKIFHQDGRKFYTRYYEAILQMIERLKPQVIGHLDKIKMYNHTRLFFDENEQNYRMMVSEVLDMVQKYDIIIELNMRGYYKHPQKFIYPGEWILKDINRRGIRLIVSSDCHRREELSKGFSEALELLKAIGFRSVWYLNNRRWEEYPIV
ncbi:MAG: histidinol-phosphatase HisJ [Bacteroidales bacterium]|nr:histidinol-phosphatase HisJ [Bacteroidales bacterium]